MSGLGVLLIFSKHTENLFHVLDIYIKKSRQHNPIEQSILEMQMAKKLMPSEILSYEVLRVAVLWVDFTSKGPAVKSLGNCSRVAEVFLYGNKVFKDYVYKDSCF